MEHKQDIAKNSKYTVLTAYLAYFLKYSVYVFMFIENEGRKQEGITQSMIHSYAANSINYYNTIIYRVYIYPIYRIVIVSQ